VGRAIKLRDVLSELPLKIFRLLQRYYQRHGGRRGAEVYQDMGEKMPDKMSAVARQLSSHLTVQHALTAVAYG
jgi:hypothetical protein